MKKNIREIKWHMITHRNASLHQDNLAENTGKSIYTEETISIIDDRSWCKRETPNYYTHTKQWINMFFFKLIILIKHEIVFFIEMKLINDITLPKDQLQMFSSFFWMTWFIYSVTLFTSQLIFY